jgi:hypothetical protein
MDRHLRLNAEFFAITVRGTMPDPRWARRPAGAVEFWFRQMQS